MKKYRRFINEDFREEQSEFTKMCWWLEELYDWDYVESEGLKQMRFDWSDGNLSFWLNDDMSGEGQLPNRIKKLVDEKGIKIYN